MSEEEIYEESILNQENIKVENKSNLDDVAPSVLTEPVILTF